MTQKKNLIKKIEENLKNGEDTKKMKTTPNNEDDPPKWKWPKIEENIKNVNQLKKVDYLKRWRQTKTWRQPQKGRLPQK